MKKGASRSLSSANFKDRIMYFPLTALKIPLQPWQKEWIVSGICFHERSESQMRGRSFKCCRKIPSLKKNPEKNNLITINYIWRSRCLSTNNGAAKSWREVIQISKCLSWYNELRQWTSSAGRVSKYVLSAVIFWKNICHWTYHFIWITYLQSCLRLGLP